MAQKIKLTRPELKRQRDFLSRFERYLPMLKLKQQQLQMMVRDTTLQMQAAQAAVETARAVFQPYRAILADRAGLNIQELAQPARIITSEQNVAGVVIPVFGSVEFPEARYSLFSTPAWVDRALLDQRAVSEKQAQYDVLREQFDRLNRELTKINQRVNLFEKVKIPECREAIRRIRIQLGDEMTAAVGRAKIAKSKLTREEQTVYGGRMKDQASEPAPVGPEDE